MEKSIFDIRFDRPAKRIQEALYREMEKRDGRTYYEWNKEEKRALKEAVDFERKKLGKSPIEMSEVEKADMCASGHIDYVLKVALYCEELVFK